MNALDLKGIDWLCDQITEGATQREICAELEIGLASLGRWIASKPEHSARVREARISAARVFEEKAGQVIEDAADPFELSKAKELAHHYRWKAAKASPKEYGEKTETVLTATVELVSKEQRDAAVLAALRADD